MRDLVTKYVDGVSYEFSKYGSEQCISMFLRTMKIIGTPMASLAAIEMKEGKISVSIQPGMFSNAIDTLFKNCDQLEVIDILKTFCSKDVLCSGKKIDFNLHYEGNLPLMLKVAKAAWEVQYGNFSDAFLGSLVSGQADTTPAPPT